MIYYVKGSAESKLLSALVSKGQRMRLCKGVYTDDLSTPVRNQIFANWMGIASHYFPDAILSHRTALELKPVAETVFVTGATRRRVDIEGLIINCVSGDVKTAIQPVLPGLFRSAKERAFLENLSPSRARK